MDADTDSMVVRLKVEVKRWLDDWGEAGLCWQAGNVNFVGERATLGIWRRPLDHKMRCAAIQSKLLRASLSGGEAARKAQNALLVCRRKGTRGKRIYVWQGPVRGRSINGDRY